METRGEVMDIRVKIIIFAVRKYLWLIETIITRKIL